MNREVTEGKKKKKIVLRCDARGKVVNVGKGDERKLKGDLKRVKG